MREKFLTWKLRRFGALAVAGGAVSGLIFATPAVSTAAQPIKLSIPPPATTNVPTEIFTGTVTKFVDGETLLIARMTSSGKEPGKMVLVHLYGVSSVPSAVLPRPVSNKNERGTTESRRDLRESVMGRKVRVEVRGKALLRNDQVLQNALVSLLPDNSSALSSPPSLSQQGAPSVAIVQTRPTDATGVSGDLPRGAAHPSLAASGRIPAPPAASPIRKEDVLNYALVREGIARWNQKEAPGLKDFSDAENDAQKSKRGLWATKK